MKAEVKIWMESKGLIARAGNIKDRFEREYPNMTPEQAYNEAMSYLNAAMAQSDLVKKLEQYLISNGYNEKQSAVSESRYYNIVGMQLRFSSHVHPTGSMTSYIIDESGKYQYSKVDLCADKHLVNDVLSILNINL
jgi:hypothetical protein